MADLVATPKGIVAISNKPEELERRADVVRAFIEFLKLSGFDDFLPLPPGYGRMPTGKDSLPIFLDDDRNLDAVAMAMRKIWEGYPSTYKIFNIGTPRAPPYHDTNMMRAMFNQILTMLLMLCNGYEVHNSKGRLDDDLASIDLAFQHLKTVREGFDERYSPKK